MSETDTTDSVESRLATLGSEALLETLRLLERGTLQGKPQPTQGITYASKIQKEEARLDFTQSAAQLDRVVRAFNPAPVAFTSFRGEPLRVWRATPRRGDVQDAAPGTIQPRDGDILVACSDGWLQLVEVQRAGGKPMTANAWAAGANLGERERLGVAV